jgi:transposase-like protein
LTAGVRIVHLLRKSLKYASKRDWPELAKDLKPIYTAPSDKAALDRFAEFSGKWQRRHPAIIRLMDRREVGVVPFLELDVETRTVIWTAIGIAGRPPMVMHHLIDRGVALTG